MPRMPGVLPGPSVMDAVPPIVNEDHLRVLLGEQHESEILDYKRELNLSDAAAKTRALVETAKDVAAMASGRGGHIVVGADGRGQPTGRVTAADAEHLDEARLRPRLERYLPDGLRIHTATHEVDGKILVLIHVSPHEDGLVIMKKKGSYKQGADEKTTFREGDIFIRRGTESRRIGQSEIRRHLHDLRRRMKGKPGQKR
jgi:predicted HTH transcriptional regulator